MKTALPETVEHWKLERLIPHARNARTHSEQQVAQIAGSIAEFGFVNPDMLAWHMSGTVMMMVILGGMGAGALLGAWLLQVLSTRGLPRHMAIPLATLAFGASLLVSGIRNGRQGFNATVAGVNGTMLLLATAALALPTLFSSLGGISTGDTFNVSHGVAIVMALLYIAYLIHAFQSPDEVEMFKCSGRMPMVLAPYFSAGAPSIMFILGEPMKPATKRFFGVL